MKKRAFTLMELVIVMALIGILASVTVPSVNDFKKTYQFTNSVEILRDSLSQGFSESRSKSEDIVLEGEKDATEFSYKNETIMLFGETKLETSFEIEFQSPFGDIDESSSENIRISNGRKIADFSIYKSSGLVEIKMFKEKKEVLQNNNQDEYISNESAD